MGDTGEQRKCIDELTGLLDKQTFYECAQKVLDEKDPDQEYIFVFFDLDNFKIFNANYGYELGDELLISLGYIINDVFYGQLVSRFSGDHFAVLTNGTQIIPAIKNIRQRIKLVQRSINIEVKAGIYVVEGDEKDVIRCCDRARMACTSIKKKYDMAYRFYDDALGGALKRKQEILDSLEEAIENKYIQIYYQPVVRVLTGEVCGWEALVRWIDPKKGVVFPNEFIPVLEEYRLIPKVDCYVMEEIFSRYRDDVRGKMKVVPVSINLSRIDFETMDVVSFLDAKMEEYECPKNMFHFEVTESALMDSPLFIMEQIKKLREKGYIVWMDDFGSGYSSLNVLKSYEFDVIKIDMDFLSDFDTHDGGKVILKHIVSMIKNLKIHTLVEGVETQEQYDFLKSIGCEMIQGYLIGRPMPYMESLKNVKRNGRELECFEQRLFCDAIGLVDVLRQNPLQNVDSSVVESPLPLALYIRENDTWKILHANDNFKNTVSLLNADNIEGLEKLLNSPVEGKEMNHKQFFAVCESSKVENRIGNMDFVKGGHIINLRVRHLCTDVTGCRDAFLVSMRVLSRFIDSNYDNRLNTISRAMFSQYECVDLFGIQDDYFENVYLNDNRLHVDFDNKSASKVISDIAEQRVHPDDKLYFKDFMDFTTVEQRLYDEPMGISVGFFRLKDARKTYVWKEIILSIMRLGNTDFLLSCVTEACNEISRQMNLVQEREIVTDENDTVEKLDKKPEFESILQFLPAGVFWKDKDRRFKGANQMFLDYYGLQSVEEILGKTDEEMGWHINPEPFKRDELAVINEGKSIEDVEGECIVKGQVRKIKACKRPYIKDRKIAGLVGYFRDITEELEEMEKLEMLSITDALTGQYNRRGFANIVQKYIAQYNRDKTDFTLIILDIDKFKQINDMYGHDYGDEILKRTSKVLSRVASDDSVVFRYGGDEFLILHQHKDMQEIDNIRHEIDMGLKRYEKMAATMIPIKVSIGHSVYSDFEDLGKCIDEADKNMYLDKEKHKKEKI